MGNTPSKWLKKTGILLTDEQISVIEGHSKGEYSSPLGQIIKIAEICRATESPRWYRGKQQPPAKSWEEVFAILKEDSNLNPAMIHLAAQSYGKSHFELEKPQFEQML